MNLIPEDIQKKLCEQLCKSVRVAKRFEYDNELMLETNFGFPDGDHYQIYLSDNPGGVRLSDKGNTLMRMSYGIEIDDFLTSPRLSLIDQILNEEEVKLAQGELFVDSPMDRISEALFRYSSAVTRIYDLTLHLQSRPTATFYDDLENLIFQKVREEDVNSDYCLPEIQDSEIYPVDYRFKGKHSDHLFMYGIPSQDKAKSVTIDLAHFLCENVSFESILVFQDQSEIQDNTLTRLRNASGEMEMIDSLGSRSVLFEKMDHRIAHISN